MKTFKELTELNEGEFCWESSQMGNLYILLIDDPVITDDVDGRKVEFNAVVVDPDDMLVRKCHYLATEKHMHYAPKICDTREYISISEMRGEIPPIDEDILKLTLLENRYVENE